MQSTSRQIKGWLRVEDAKGRDKLLIGQTGGEVWLSLLLNWSWSYKYCFNILPLFALINFWIDGHD